MNFLENFINNRTKQKEEKQATKELVVKRVDSSFKNFKYSLPTFLNTAGKAELIIKDLDASDHFSRAELGKYISNSAEDMLNDLNAECDVYFRTYMADDFAEIKVEFSVFSQPGREKWRRYAYRHLKNKVIDLSANATVKYMERNENREQAQA